MMLFKKQIEFVQNFEKQIFKSLEQAINVNGLEIAEYITEKQLYEKGIDGTGNPLKNQQTGRMGYTRMTIRIKKSKGQPTDRVTLRDDNVFHPSVTIDAFEDRFEVRSNVGYAKYLIKRYGENILKPTKENMTLFFEKHLISEIKNSIL